MSSVAGRSATGRTVFSKVGAIAKFKRSRHAEIELTQIGGQGTDRNYRMSTCRAGNTRAHFQFLDKVTTGKGCEAKGRHSPNNSPARKSARRGGSAGTSDQR